MAIFAGKFIHGAAFELQSRVFLKPWVKKIMVRCCSNFGERSKDFPVRYTPKRSSKFNELDDSTPSPKDSENHEVHRFTSPDSSSVEIPNSGKRSMIGLILDEKSPDNDFKSGKLKSNEKKILNSALRSEVGEHDCKWRFAESNSIEELDEFDALEGPEEVLDELDINNGDYEIKHLAPEPSKTKEAAEKTTIRFPVRHTPKRSSKFNKLDDSTPSSKDSENHEVHRFTNPDSSSVEIPNGGKKSMIGLILDEKSPDNDFKSGKLKSNEKKILNSALRSEVGEHDCKWRFAESNSIEELDEFDALEGPEEVLDELDINNGNYELKRLAPEPSKTKEAAEKTTIRLLAARAYTALELKKKLLGKKFSHEVVNAVISDFQNRGFINDFSYAETFSRSRWSSSSWGPHRIKLALTKKGVNDLDAQKALKLVFEDGEPSDDQGSRLGLSKPSLDHLFAQASKQWLRAKDLPIEKQKSRIITWLQYRGFNWGVISFILKKLQSGHPS